MSIVFNLVLHVLLVGSLVLFAVVIFATALTTTNKIERALRVAALFAGALVAVGAQVSGMDYATYTVNALAGARPASATAAIVTSAIPALMGAGIGFFIVRSLRSSETMAIRIMGFVGMLAVTAFIQVYAQAASVNGFTLGAAALPNIAFTAGVILTAVFTYRTDEAPKADRPTLGASLVGFLRDRQSAASNRQRVNLAPPTTSANPDSTFKGL